MATLMRSRATVCDFGTPVEDFGFELSNIGCWSLLKITDDGGGVSFIQTLIPSVEELRPSFASRTDEDGSTRSMHNEISYETLQRVSSSRPSEYLIPDSEAVLFAGTRGAVRSNAGEGDLILALLKHICGKSYSNHVSSVILHLNIWKRV